MDKLTLDNMTALLRKADGVSDFKVVNVATRSYEQFFVHGKLETVRECDSDDYTVTVYNDHDGKRGASSFDVPASLDEAGFEAKVKRAVAGAAMCFDEAYSLPQNATCIANLPSNLDEMSAKDVASRVAQIIAEVNVQPDCDINALEVFVTKRTTRVLNSRGVDKTQVKHTLSIEAIPTCNGAEQSVELFETYTLSDLDEQWLRGEITARLKDVAARLHAQKPAEKLTCPVIFNAYELRELFDNLIEDCNMASVYAHANLLSVGDALQSAPQADKLNVTMRAAMPSCPASAAFDADGYALTDRQIIKDGRLVALYGTHRFAQYLGEAPTGALGCVDVKEGTLSAAQLSATPHLELIYLSGLQVDVYNDYIGGEVRLAYYYDGARTLPVTGIAISGKLSDALNTVQLSRERTTLGGYSGPAKLKMDGLNIF